MSKEKTYVEDVDRSLYDFRYDENDQDFYKVDSGLTPEIVEQISEEKNDPDWMRELRLKALEIFNQKGMGQWGPPIDGLNMDDIVTYVRPKTKMSANWEDVPKDIKDTFERLGIPQAERKSLAGVGAQYDSELVYHNVRKEVAEQGVVYTDIESISGTSRRAKHKRKKEAKKAKEQMKINRKKARQAKVTNVENGVIIATIVALVAAAGLVVWQTVMDAKQNAAPADADTDAAE